MLRSLGFTSATWTTPLSTSASQSASGEPERSTIDAALRLLAQTDASEIGFIGVADEAGVVHGTVYNYFRLRDGRRRGELRYESDQAALDLVLGTTLAAMRTVVEGRARGKYDEVTVRVVLRGLGVDARRVERLATLPLPSPRSR